MRLVRAWLLGCLLLASSLSARAEPNHAVYFYETRSVSLCEWKDLVDELAAQGYRRIYLNLDEGNFFLLDEVSSRKKITEMARLAYARGLELDALTLQDTRWLEGWAEAVGRVGRLQAFLRENPQVFSGLHIDVEPHAHQGWEQHTAGERVEILQKFAFLLRKIREQVKQSKPKLRFSAALPWWFAATGDEVVRTALPEIHRELDEVVLMAYDEPGTKLFGEGLATLDKSLDLHRFLKRLPRHRTARLAVATYDFASPESLARGVTAIERRYVREKRFAGVAVFHRSSQYGAHAGRGLSGVVLDASTEQPLAGAVVEIVEGEGQTISSRCGVFRLSGLGRERVTVRIAKSGYETATIEVPLLEPGRDTVLGPTSLRFLPKSSASTTP